MRQRAAPPAEQQLELAVDGLELVTLRLDVTGGGGVCRLKVGAAPIAADAELVGLGCFDRPRREFCGLLSSRACHMKRPQMPTTEPTWAYLLCNFTHLLNCQSPLLFAIVATEVFLNLHFVRLLLSQALSQLEVPGSYLSQFWGLVVSWLQKLNNASRCGGWSLT